MSLKIKNNNESQRGEWGYYGASCASSSAMFMHNFCLACLILFVMTGFSSSRYRSHVAMTDFWCTSVSWEEMLCSLAKDRKAWKDLIVKLCLCGEIGKTVFKLQKSWNFNNKLDSTWDLKWDKAWVTKTGNTGNTTDRQNLIMDKTQTRGDLRVEASVDGLALRSDDLDRLVSWTWLLWPAWTNASFDGRFNDSLCFKIYSILSSFWANGNISC